MRFRTGLVVAVLLLAAATTLTQPAERTWAERMWIDERRNYEQWLLTAEIEGLGAVGEGVTNPTKVTLSHDGRVFYAIYKPLKRGRQKG